MQRVDVSYLVIPVDNTDEAESLASYLNEHGVCAFAQEDNEVNCPRENADTVTTVDLLLKTWRMFWDYSDSGLMGLPMYVKN